MLFFLIFLFGCATPFGMFQHDTGLCKNLLQEYAQKMNYAIPSYECQKVEKLGSSGHGFFSCTVDIGGIKYIGAAARSKKEAELKAARTALLAIQSDPSLSSKKLNASSMYTVVPGKKKVSDLGINSQETAAALKPKKGRFKKKQRKRRPRERGKHVQDKNTRGNLDVNTESQAVPEANKSDAVVAQVTDSGLPPMEAIHDERLKFNGNDGKPTVERGYLVPCGGGDI